MKNLKKQSIKISGWGLNKHANVKIFKPSDLKELINFIKSSQQKSILARGLGRSYGDASLLDGKTIIKMDKFKKICLNTKDSTITVGAGVSIREILSEVVHKGFFLPVIPGTSNVTVGGAIAADVHGKNHYKDGSFGSNIIKISIVDGSSKVQELDPENEYHKFWATVGGMGLTGVIFEATIKLFRISSSLISVDTKRFKDLNSLMLQMDQDENYYKYNVAWIDSLNKNFRGVLTRGNHINFEDLNPKEKFNPLEYKEKVTRSLPDFLPGNLLNKYSVRAFNSVYFYKSPKDSKNEHQSVQSFFHPLDALEEWNKIYGKKGFIQYQFCVPNNSNYLIEFVLNTLRKNNIPSFLTVLKKFGVKNSSLLSFPSKGWTLATDIPNSKPNIYKVLDFLDNEIKNCGGKIYLAKDSRQSVLTFKQTYPKLREWMKIKKELDPENKFISDMGKRLEFF